MDPRNTDPVDVAIGDLTPFVRPWHSGPRIADETRAICGALATVLRLLTTQAEEVATLREQVIQIGAQLQWSGQETARRLVSELLKQAPSGSRAAVIGAREETLRPQAFQESLGPQACASELATLIKSERGSPRSR